MAPNFSVTGFQTSVTRKPEAEGAQRRQGALNQRDDDAAEDDEDRNRGGAGEMAEDGITQPQALKDLGPIDADRRP